MLGGGAGAERELVFQDSVSLCNLGYPGTELTL